MPCSIAELADGVVSLAPTTTSSPEMAASSFSYAQAARGQGGPTAAAPASTTNSQHDQAGVEPAPSKPVSLPPASVDVADQEQTSSAPSIATIDRHDIDSTSGLDSDARSESVHERRFDLRRDDDVGRLDRPWRRNDKGTRSSSATTRSVDEQDSRKPRKANKKKPSDKQSAESASVTDQDPEAKPEQPKVELSEAPIPSVNIWQQRKEAQQAKAAPAVETATESANGLPSSSPHVKSTAGAPPQNGVPDSITSNGIKPQAKANENVRPERNGSRGARALARDGKTEVPPPVGDSASWPTPETAISTTSEDRKKTADKGDRLEKDGQDDKPRQKKNWMAYEYVPTVTFETQLPPARGSKPRGGAKGANGTRTTAPSTGDKPAGPAAPAKAAETRERIREAPNGTNRNTSDPPVSKRPPFETTNLRAEPKKPASNVGADKTKDVAAPSNTEHSHTAREPRSDRGRGGYRGRGAHHGLNSHGQHQHPVSSATSTAFPAMQSSRSQGPYSPPPRQGAHGQGFMPPPQRGGRGGRGGGSNYHRMSLPNGSSRPAPVQTQFGPFDYPPAPMSAAPFQQTAPYWDHMVIPMLRSQIEYYFSIENLCKDMYLRRRMDSQGYVPLLFIAAFKRMRELSPDPALLRAVCEESSDIEYVVGDDDCERLRRREGWETWVLPWDQRDELARNNGPMHVTFKSKNFNYPPQFNGMASAPYGVPSPANFSGNGQQFYPFPDEHNVPHTNGFVNGNGFMHGAPSQLSAEVPDFSPSQLNGISNGADANHAPLVNGHGHGVNGIHSQEAGQS